MYGLAVQTANPFFTTGINIKCVGNNTPFAGSMKFFITPYLTNSTDNSHLKTYI